MNKSQNRKKQQKTNQGWYRFTSCIISLLLILLLPAFARAQNFSCQWAHAGGDTADVSASGQAVDAEGNVYITGNFLVGSMTFDNSLIHLLPNTDVGANKVFLIKYAPNGNIIWAKSFESSFDASGTSITIDQQGNIYLTGYFGFSINFGNLMLTENTGSSRFLAKFDSSGNVQWAEKLTIGNFFVNNEGDVLIYGAFSTPTLSLGNFNLINSDNNGQSTDLFIAKQDPNGTVLWAKSDGATGQNEEISNVIAGANGAIYVSGTFEASFTLNGIPISGTGNTTTYEKDWFAARYDASGNVTWVKSGGLTRFNAPVITTDPAGNLYLTGMFDQSTTLFDNQTLNGIGISDPYNLYWFAGKYDTAGNLQWAESGGSPVLSIQLIPGEYGSAYFIGMFHSSATFGNITLSGTGSGQGNGTQDFDGFCARYDANGAVLWAKHFGPHLSFYSLMSAVPDDQGVLSISGSYGSFSQTSDSTISFDAFSLTSLGSTDVFLARYDSLGNVQTAKNIGGSSSEGPITQLKKSPDGSLYLYGQYYSASLDLDTITLGFPLQHANYFLAKFGVPNADTGTSIHTITAKNILQVFPNPTTGSIRLKSTKNIATIQVCNVTGREVYYQTLAVPQKEYTLDLGSLSNGVYWLKIENKEGFAIKKIVLSK